MAIIALQNPTEIKYQQATKYFTEAGISHALKRQWQFLKEQEQRHVLSGVVLFTIATLASCTFIGLKVGKDVAHSFGLKDEKKQAVVLCGGGVGFATGVAVSVTGNGLLIEHSERLAQWKNVRIHEIVKNLMRDEFEDDPIWSQFKCSIGQSNMFTPVRTPGGQAFECDNLMKAADERGMIPDIYNKRIPAPTAYDPHATQRISYSIGACIKDDEMIIVVYKRFRHLATQKSMEPGLSSSTKHFFLCFRNSLGEFVKPIYMDVESKIVKKRNEAQQKIGVSEEEVKLAELVYNDEISAFKTFFGATPLDNIDWSVERDWNSILNTRWMSKYHT